MEIINFFSELNESLNSFLNPFYRVAILSCILGLITLAFLSCKYERNKENKIKSLKLKLHYKIVAYLVFTDIMLMCFIYPLYYILSNEIWILLSAIIPISPILWEISDYKSDKEFEQNKDSLRLELKNKISEIISSLMGNDYKLESFKIRIGEKSISYGEKVETPLTMESNPEHRIFVKYKKKSITYIPKNSNTDLIEQIDWKIKNILKRKIAWWTVEIERNGKIIIIFNE